MRSRFLASTQRVLQGPRVLLVFAIAALGTLSACSAEDATAPPPGEIRLLEGYQHERLQGVDTDVGRIFKEGGLSIEYDIGLLSLAGNYAKHVSDDELAWFREQKIDGQLVQIAFTKDHKLYVTFPNRSAEPEQVANFETTVTSPEQMADVLLMVLTYRSEHPEQPAGGNGDRKLRRGEGSG